MVTRNGRYGQGRRELVVNTVVTMVASQSYLRKNLSANLENGLFLAVLKSHVGAPRCCAAPEVNCWLGSARSFVRFVRPAVGVIDKMVRHTALIIEASSKLCRFPVTLRRSLTLRSSGPAFGRPLNTYVRLRRQAFRENLWLLEMGATVKVVGNSL